MGGLKAKQDLHTTATDPALDSSPHTILSQTVTSPHRPPNDSGVSIPRSDQNYLPTLVVDDAAFD